MKPPFEGLLGDTCETRLLQFLLPMYGIEFDMAELVEEIGLTRQSIAKAMNKFAARGMVTIRKDGRTPLYSINEDSPLVMRLVDFDNSLIESMVGKEAFDRIRNAEGNVRSPPGRNADPTCPGKTRVPYPDTHGKPAGIASSETEYRAGKGSGARKNISRK